MFVIFRFVTVAIYEQLLFYADAGSMFGTISFICNNCTFKILQIHVIIVGDIYSMKFSKVYFIWMKKIAQK